MRDAYIRLVVTRGEGDLGIDPDKEVYTRQGRPMKLVDDGSLIDGLFA